MKSTSRASIALIALAAMPSIARQTAQAPAQTPAPKIAVLPVINASGDRWIEHKDQVTDRVTKRLTKVFGDRGFTFSQPTEIDGALKKEQMDLTDEECYRRDNFYKVGEDVGADYVAFVEVTAETQRTQQTFFVNSPEGEVTIKYWLMDVKNHAPVYSAKSNSAKAHAAAWLGFAKGSDQQLTAADRVVTDTFKDFLERFPKASTGNGR